MIDNWEWHAMAFDFVEDHTLEYIYQAFKERMMKELTVIESHIKHAPPDLVNREDL